MVSNTPLEIELCVDHRTHTVIESLGNYFNIKKINTRFNSSGTSPSPLKMARDKNRRRRRWFFDMAYSTAGSYNRRRHWGYISTLPMCSDVLLGYEREFHMMDVLKCSSSHPTSSKQPTSARQSFVVEVKTFKFEIAPVWRWIRYQQRQRMNKDHLQP